MGRWQVVTGFLMVIVAVVGCSTFTPDEKHHQRLEKAAGITAFRIRCTQDLWKRTGGHKCQCEVPGVPCRCGSRT